MRYHGKGGRVYLAGTGAAIAVVTLSDWILNMKRPRSDVTVFGDTNAIWVQGLPAYDGSVAGFWDNVDDTLFAASEQGAPVAMALYPALVLVPTRYWTGNAWVDATIDIKVLGPCALSGTYAAAGNWSRF